MSDQRDDLWRSPALDRFGEQLGCLAEREARRARAVRRRRAQRMGAVVSAASALGVVLFLVVASGHHVGTASAGVNQAATAAERAGTLTFRSTTSLTVVGGESETVLERGAIDFRVGSYRILVASGRHTPGLERVVVPGALYVKQTGALLATAWQGVRLQHQPLLALGGRGVADPLGLLHVLRESHGAVRIGVQRIGGVATVHYRLTTTLAAFLALHNEQSVVGAAREVGAVVDVWIDHANRIRRADRLFVRNGSHQARLLITTSFSDYGTPVSIHAPAGVQLVGTQGPTGPVSEPLSASVLSLLRPSLGSGSRFEPQQRAAARRRRRPADSGRWMAPRGRKLAK